MVPLHGLTLQSALNAIVKVLHACRMFFCRYGILHCILTLEENPIFGFKEMCDIHVRKCQGKYTVEVRMIVEET